MSPAYSCGAEMIHVTADPILPRGQQHASQYHTAQQSSPRLRGSSFGHAFCQKCTIVGIVGTVSVPIGPNPGDSRSASRMRTGGQPVPSAGRASSPMRRLATCADSATSYNSNMPVANRTTSTGIRTAGSITSRLSEPGGEAASTASSDDVEDDETDGGMDTVAVDETLLFWGRAVVTYSR